MFDIFDGVAERICSNCINATEDCYHDGDTACPFWNEFLDLKKICAQAEELANNINRSAQEDYWAAAQYAYECGDY